MRPHEAFRPKTTLVIACGALARELVAVVRANRLDHLKIACLPAILHNRPERIAPAVREKIRANQGHYDRILCLYGDCGTGGELDRVLAEEGVERIEGAHCYEFFMGTPDYERIMEADPAVFYLTDYLVRHFDRLVIEGLGLDRFPDLLSVYFGNYKRVIYLAQVEDEALTRRAEAAAARLGLAFERRFTGMAALNAFLVTSKQEPSTAPPSSVTASPRHLLPQGEKECRPAGPASFAPRERGEGGARRQVYTDSVNLAAKRRMRGKRRTTAVLREAEHDMAERA